MGKSRTFNGCWTCRSRKVKCDLTKPKCMRCCKAGIECRGFDLKLGWADPLTVSKDNKLVPLNVPGSDSQDTFQRRNVTSVKFPALMRYETYKKVTEVLELLDMQLAKGPCTIGPFSMMEFRRKRPRQDDISTQPPPKKIVPQVSQKKPVNILNGTQVLNSEVNDTPGGSFFTVGSNWVHPQLLEYAKLTIVAIKGPSYRLTEQNMLHILYPRFFPNVDSDDWFANIKVMERLFVLDVSNNELRLRLLFRQLLANITPDLFSFNHVAYTNNYLASVVIPYLKQIICEYVCQNFAEYDAMLPEDPTEEALGKSIKLAIVYLTLGMASFGMSQKLEAQGKESSNSANSPNSVSGSTSANRSGSMNRVNSVSYGSMDRMNSINSSISLATSMNLPNDSTNLIISSNTINRAGSVNTLNSTRLSITSPADTFGSPGSTCSLPNTDPQEFLTVAIEFRKLAIRLVNHHLDEYDNHDELLSKTANAELLEYETLLLLAIVLQLELDGRFSVFENYDVMFAIGDYIIKNKFRTAKHLSVTRFLITIFKITYTMYESTQAINLFNYEISEKDERKKYPDLNPNYDLAGDCDDESDHENESDDSSSPHRKVVVTSNGSSNDNRANGEEYAPLSFTITFDKTDVSSYSRAEDVVPDQPKVTSIPRVFSGLLDTNGIYLMYGIPKLLFDIFHEVVHLTNHKNIFETRRVFPRNFPKICADVEDRLISWLVLQYWKFDPQSVFDRCVWLNVEAFQKAVRVYYMRLVKGKEADIVREAELCLDKLQQIENESIREEGIMSQNRVRPMFWVLFVCGAEARLPEQIQRVEKLSTGPLFRDLPNYWRAKQILFEIWKRREGDEECGFMDIVREWEIHLCLA